jgi:hypothetical protein
MTIKWLKWMQRHSKQVLKQNSSGPLSHIESYMIYYGTVNEQIINSLKEYDMVVIEPQHFTKQAVNDLQSAGTIVIGYISVMEWPSWNKKRQAALYPSDFYLHQQQRQYFPEWDSYLMDLRQNHYRQVLLDEIANQISSKSMDGIFLDTVGDIEDHLEESDAANGMLYGYLELLKAVKSCYPRLSLIQNRGFYVVEWSAPYLDGFVWENWQGALIKNDWVQDQLGVLKPLRKAGLQLFSVTCYPQYSDVRESNPGGFVHLSRYGDYAEWPLSRH